MKISKGRFDGSIGAIRETLVALADRAPSLFGARDRDARSLAVTQTAQMLAHDVRRPFGMLRAAIEQLERARDPAVFRVQSALLLAEVKLAADTADALIADVIEIGTGSAAMRREPVAPQEIIANALRETLRVYPTAEVAFEYSFAHEGAIEVDARKVQRVFSNVVANAIQAMDHCGRIWFTTAQVVGQGGVSLISFTIANDGPPIPKRDVANLFDPFFTRNKPTGTGLGLAIAHRIVTAHGGTIECVRSQEQGAAFRFTLPSTTATPPPPPHLPTHSSELGWRAVKAPDSSEAPPSARNAPPPSQFAFIDDSRAFLFGWRTALTGNAGAHFFTSPEAFWKTIDGDPTLLGRLSAVVTDYRFRNSRQTGVSFARALKLRRADLPVLLASSGYVSPREMRGLIDVELDKSDVSWPVLVAALKSASGRPGARRA